MATSKTNLVSEVLLRITERLAVAPERMMVAGAGVLPWLIHSSVETVHLAPDVKLVVSEVDTEMVYNELRDEIEKLELPGSIELFVTPYDRAGNFNRWHAAALDAASSIEGGGRLVSPVYFLAIELERDDWLEPCLLLVAHRPDIVELVQRSSEDVRAFLSARFRSHLFEEQMLRSKIEAALKDGECGEVEQTLERLRGIAELAKQCDPVALLGALLSGGSSPSAPSPIPPGAVAFPKSKTVRFAAYDKLRSMMTVGFVEDRTYHYFAVPERVFEALREAPKPGRFINQEVRDRFPYEEA